MPPQHKDRLSVLDNSFLDLERDTSHMHVGGLMAFAGPPPDVEELRSHVERRLHLVPRYRQKVARPRLQLGRPMWVDDPCFNLEYHVRHTALPRPGGADELRALAGRIFSQRLDRTKPLWEMWLVEGLEGGRFALINKAHHALIDGMSGVDLVSLLFDLTEFPRDVPPPDEPWHPRPAPSDVEVAAEGVKELARAPFAVAGKALGAVRHPRRAVGDLVEGAQAIVDILRRPLFTPAPPSPLNRSIGPHRRTWWVSAELEDFKAIKRELGGTVNDVVLTVVTAALRRWLADHGTRTEGLELRALVPVSIRREDQRNTMGNQVAAMRGPLPVYVADPVERLRVVREAMQGLKESKQALGAEVIAGLQEFAPPNLLAQASRLNFSTRLFNLIVTNVPGPQVPVYLLGRELEELVPFAFLPADHALAVAIMSYHGRLDFGLLADYDAVPDVHVLARYLREAIDELLLEVRRRQPAPAPASAPRAPAAAAAPAEAGADSEELAHVDSEPVVVAVAADPGAHEGPGPQLSVEEPWEGYDAMRSDAIVQRLAGADEATLARVRLYEGTHRRRQGVLRATERSLSR